MSFLGRLFGVFFTPAKTFRSLAERPVWLDALAVVLATGAAFSYLAFPFVQQDRLRTFEDSSAGFIEKHGEHQYEDAVARIKDKSRALEAFILKPMIALTGLLLVSLIALGVGRALTHGGHFLQVFSCFLHAAFVVALPGNAVRLALITARRSALQASTGLSALFPDLPAGSTAHAALSRVDLFSFWMYGLFGLGLASAFKLSTGKGLTIGYSLWLLRGLAGFTLAVAGKGLFL